MKHTLRALVGRLGRRHKSIAKAPEETVNVAMLLSGAGGFLDAFTWLGHGGVFANAQSGNVVLLGLYAASGQWHKSLRHVPPILAFFAGVFVAYYLRVQAPLRKWHRAALLCLAIEIVFLLIVATLPETFPDIPIVLGVAFVAALQSTSFAKVEGSPYSSVMTTGNLRRTAELLFAGTFSPREPGALHQARIFLMVCGSFALGACIGAFFTPRFGNVAVVVPAVALALALFHCLRQREGDGRAGGVR